MVFKENKKFLEKIPSINKKTIHIDELKQKLKWENSKVAKHLLQMEFKDLISPLPGKMFKRKI